MKPVPITPLPVEKSTPVPTARPKYVSTPRFEQDFRAMEGRYRRSQGSEPETVDFFNRQAHYRPHHSPRQIVIIRVRAHISSHPSFDRFSISQGRFSHSASAGTVPNSRPPLIGREAERANARAFLLEEAVPLLTLSGPGGVGKTSLAQKLAHDVAEPFADGAVFVDLAPLADAIQVPVAVAAALETPVVGYRSSEVVILSHLQPRQLLLILDNCEHMRTLGRLWVTTSSTGTTADATERTLDCTNE
jgi:hypothetical protein